MHTLTNEHARARTFCSSRRYCPIHCPSSSCHRHPTFSPSTPSTCPPPPNAARIFCDAHIACPRACTAAAKHSCIVDAGPSLARRRRPGRFAGQCGCPPRRAQNTRTNHEPRVAHPHSHDTTHRPRAATGARHPGRAVTRCVGARAARSEARSACHASLHQYHRTPQPARVTVSVRRSRPPTGHRRAAGGDATTTAPPLPDRRATRGVSSRCNPQQCSRRSPQISAGGDPKRRLFTFAFSETLRAPLPKPLAVVKWYRINAYWYKPGR